LRPAGIPARGQLQECLGYVDGALRVFDGIDGSGQDDGIFDRLRVDHGRWHHLAQHSLKPANINLRGINLRGADAELQGGNLLALLIQGKNACLPGVHADYIELARGPDDGVGDLRLGDEDFRRVPGQGDNA
jgi:hypothetical protein